MDARLSEHRWVLFNLNRKGTVLYFTDSAKSNQRWTPSPKLATRLTFDAAEVIGKKSHGIGARVDWLMHLQPREIAGLLRAHYREATENRLHHPKLVSFLQTTRSRPELVTPDRKVTGGVPTPESPS